jgi:DNA-binding transcriptional regulator YiaG
MAEWTGPRLKKLRARYAESQRVFAARIGVATDTYQGWEQGDGVPSLPTQRLLDRLKEDAEGGNIRPHPQQEFRPSKARAKAATAKA